MVSATITSLRRTLRRTRASTVLAVQLVLALLTVGAAWQMGWQPAIVGLVLMHLCTAGAAVGPWGGRPTPTRPAPKPRDSISRKEFDAHRKELDASRKELKAHRKELEASRKELEDLEQRVDAQTARMVASAERTRVEVLDAITNAPPDWTDRASR